MSSDSRVSEGGLSDLVSERNEDNNRTKSGAAEKPVMVLKALTNHSSRVNQRSKKIWLSEINIIGSR